MSRIKGIAKNVRIQYTDNVICAECGARVSESEAKNGVTFEIIGVCMECRATKYAVNSNQVWDYEAKHNITGVEVAQTEEIEVVEEVKAEEKALMSTTIYAAIEAKYQAMTVKQLKEIASQESVDVRGMRKDAIVSDLAQREYHEQAATPEVAEAIEATPVQPAVVEESVVSDGFYNSYVEDVEETENYEGIPDAPTVAVCAGCFFGGDVAHDTHCTLEENGVTLHLQVITPAAYTLLSHNLGIEVKGETGSYNATLPSEVEIKVVNSYTTCYVVSPEHHIHVQHSYAEVATHEQCVCDTTCHCNSVMAHEVKKQEQLHAENVVSDVKSVQSEASVEQGLTLHEALQQSSVVYKRDGDGYYVASKANFSSGYFLDFKSFDPLKHSSLSTSPYHVSVEDIAQHTAKGWQLDKPTPDTLVRFAVEISDVTDKYYAIVATPDGVRHFIYGYETVQDVLDEVARRYGHNTINVSVDRVKACSMPLQQQEQVQHASQDALPLASITDTSCDSSICITNKNTLRCPQCHSTFCVGCALYGSDMVLRCNWCETMLEPRTTVGEALKVMHPDSVEQEPALPTLEDMEETMLYRTPKYNEALQRQALPSWVYDEQPTQAPLTKQVEQQQRTQDVVVYDDITYVEQEIMVATPPVDNPEKVARMGKVATSTGLGYWISNKSDNEDAHRYNVTHLISGWAVGMVYSEEQAERFIENLVDIRDWNVPYETITKSLPSIKNDVLAARTNAVDIVELYPSIAENIVRRLINSIRSRTSVDEYLEQLEDVAVLLARVADGSK